MSSFYFLVSPEPSSIAKHAIDAEYIFKFLCESIKHHSLIFNSICTLEKSIATESLGYSLCVCSIEQNMLFLFILL